MGYFTRSVFLLSTGKSGKTRFRDMSDDANIIVPYYYNKLHYVFYTNNIWHTLIETAAAHPAVLRNDGRVRGEVLVRVKRIYRIKKKPLI